MTNNNTVEYITKAKFDELTKQLEELKTVERKKIAEKLDYARSLGDLSENAEYHDAREQQSELEARIATIEATLANAKIVKGHKTDVVSIGSTVSIQRAGSAKPIEYEIVGSAEADMLANKLSFKSPLGQILLDKKVGDTVILEAPKGSVKYTIKKIS